MPVTHYTRLGSRARRVVRRLPLTVVLVLSRSLFAQQVAGSQVDCWRRASGGAADSAAALSHRVVTATRIAGIAPRIDGRLDEPAWCATDPFGDFVESRPRPGRIATLPTVVRVLYDAAAIYVAVRLYDPHPDSILAPYPRRDDETVSDWVFVEMDSRHDRRTGYSFGLNPRGVQVDGTWFGDVNYDAAWNGVWDGAASIDSTGWSAEFRIPFSQIALGQSDAGGALRFGLNVYRYTPHIGETSNWSPRLPSVLGVVSRFNDLVGLVAPPRHIPAEVVPYLAATTVNDRGPPATTAKSGADLRMRLTPNTLIAATIHPDFGQVEADPSQINLTTFETLLSEQRPFFVEGADVFRFDTGLQFSARGTTFADESPFYSRRIGGPPHGTVTPGASGGEVPAATTLLGAIRASGRTAGGLSGGLFQGETASSYATYVDSAGVNRKALVEPPTHFSVARATREFGDGRANIGAMATVVARTGMDARMDSVLIRDALVTGVDGRLRFLRGTYEGTGFVMASWLDGSPFAIRSAREEPRHGYNRPDASRPSHAIDTTVSSMNGLAAQLALARVEGRWKWGVASRVVTQGFEANDAGFQRNANWILGTANWKYERFLATSALRHWSIGSNQIGAGWTLGGDRRAAVANLTAAVDARRYWGGALSVDHEGSSFDPEVLRGGPALLLPASDRWTASLYSDTRRRWQLTLGASARREPSTASHNVSVTPDFSAFITDRLQVGLTPSFGHARVGWQYVAQPVDATGHAHYLLGALDQQTASLTSRVTYAFSQHLTLQGYAQAFTSGGTYGGFAEVANPRATNSADRVIAISAARLQRDSATSSFILDAGGPTQSTFSDPAFSRREFHLNGLLRYEYSPGSTLFLVWTQERIDSDLEGFGVGRDVGRLWRAPAADALSVKISYWLAR